MNNIKLVDCTIRDGGHLNNWNFPIDCVRDSYNAAKLANVDLFEIGYRNFEKNDYGEFYTCRDEFLSEFIEISESCRIAVMADMGKSSIDLFKSCEKSLTPISSVFVATYLKDLKEALTFCEQLYDKGYSVFLNLMAIYEYNNDDFKILKLWQNKDILESIYFADSFGAFYPDDIKDIVKNLKLLGYEKIGFHSHNNLQLAFANTLQAIDMGLYATDASVYGMGRGAGNLPIELLISYLSKYDSKYNILPYLRLIEKYYINFYNTLGWGYNLNSLTGGVKSIHPKYVQELSKNNDIDRIWKLSDIIHTHHLTSYNDKEMKKILYQPN